MTKRFLILLSTVLAVGGFAASSAFASTTQVSIVQDNTALFKNPTKTLAKIKSMGATMVKVGVYWDQLAPSPNSTKAPKGFSPTTPSDYDKYLTPLKSIDEIATADGLKVGFMLTAPVPRWAEGTAGCTSEQINTAHTCRPNIADFKAFATAVATQFNGSNNEPKVNWYSIWNEPNYIPNIAPQSADNNKVNEGAVIYRDLLNAGWQGLAAGGIKPSNATILFGELAPRGISGSRSLTASGSKPLAFLASLYCKSTSGRRLTGSVAKQSSCGSSAAAFKKANPALYDASGFAMHPYSQGVAPNMPTYDCYIPTDGIKWSFCSDKAKKSDSLWYEMGSLGRLSRTLRKYSGKTFALWNTEYGYWTTPPGTKYVCRGSLQSACSLSQAKAAYYMNWAEYLSYKNSLVKSYDQYQLNDPAGNKGGWTDGLLTTSGKAKATYAAFVTPMFMPTTSVKRASNLTVWGGVRPAAYDSLTYSITPKVAIQFKAKGAKSWSTLKTVSITNAEGYFDTKVDFTKSGSVRLSYGSGTGHGLTSRVQAITVK